MDRAFFILGSLSGGLAVAFGAFAAHGLRARLTPDLLATFETGARYQMYHVLGAAGGRLGGDALDALGVSKLRRLAFRRRHRPVFVQPLSAGADGAHWLGAITPLGGVAFVAGWVCLALAAWRG